MIEWLKRKNKSPEIEEIRCSSCGGVIPPGQSKIIIISKNGQIHRFHNVHEKNTWKEIVDQDPNLDTLIQKFKRIR